MALSTGQQVAIADAQIQIDLAQQSIAVSKEAITTYQAAITTASSDIEFAKSQLQNPDLPSDRKVYYEATIAAETKVIATNELNIQTQQNSIAENTSVITANETFINDVSQGQTSAPTPTLAPVEDASPSVTPTRDQPVNPSEDPEIAAVQAAAAEADAVVTSQNQAVDDQDPFEAARLAAIAAEDTEPHVYTAAELGVEEDGWLAQKFGEAKQYFNRQTLKSEDAQNAAAEAAAQQKAREQQTLGARLKTPTNGDWRVRISLAANSDYLYNDSTNTLLAPLKATNGVIFPYTPSIETNYKASYDTTDLTHSNYRGYFYKNSYVDAVSVRGTFTAQDTREASYLLATIHFFRSVTKMFYGQDPAYRGSPPPLVYLIGLGQYQFNNHPCLVSNFTYNLPNDVDYIRVDPNNYGLNMLAQKTPAFTGAGNLLSAIKARLTSAGEIPLGGIFQPPVQSTVNQTVNTVNRATYVPTKMDISLTLLPVQSRQQVSQQFSFKDFANGNQLKGGFW